MVFDRFQTESAPHNLAEELKRLLPDCWDTDDTKFTLIRLKSDLIIAQITNGRLLDIRDAIFVVLIVTQRGIF